MSTEISPQVRLIAVVGLVAALLGGGGMMVLGRGAAEEEEPLPPPFFQAIDKADATAGKAADRQAAVGASAAGAPAAESEPAAKPKPAAEPVPEPAPAPKPKPPPKLVADNGLPMSVHTALQRHEVVVVSLFAPNAGLDAMVVQEARAGARAAGAGFVAVNVLDEVQGEALAKLFGVQEPPAVLVYRSPDDLRFRFDGFVDLATVAQAATSARS